MLFAHNPQAKGPSWLLSPPRGMRRTYQDLGRELKVEKDVRRPSAGTRPTRWASCIRPSDRPKWPRPWHASRPLFVRP